MRSRMGQFSAQSAERERRTAHFLVLLDVVIVRMISSPHFGPSSFLELFLGSSVLCLCAFPLHRLSSSPIAPRCAAALLSIACSRCSRVILRVSFRSRQADPKSLSNSRTMAVLQSSGWVSAVCLKLFRRESRDRQPLLHCDGLARMQNSKEF